MLFGRPVNLWIGAFTVTFNLIVVVLAALVPPIVIPAVVVGAVGAAFGVIVALIANQPPTLNPGDTFTTKTAPGQPNYTTTVAAPPAHDAPPVPHVRNWIDQCVRDVLADVDDLTRIARAEFGGSRQ